MARIVKLQLQVSRRHLSDEQLVQFVARAGPAIVNPHTGSPLHFDPARKTIDLQPPADRDQLYFSWPMGPLQGAGTSSR
jgi:hypothetical protein